MNKFHYTLIAFIFFLGWAWLNKDPSPYECKHNIKTDKILCVERSEVVTVLMQPGQRDVFGNYHLTTSYGRAFKPKPKPEVTTETK